MTVDELLDDLDMRLKAGQENLNVTAAVFENDRFEHARLIGKRQGLELVQDWLRSYR